MLTIICGEDHEASRSYYNSLLDDYKKKNYEIIYLDPTQFSEIRKWMNDSPSLFGQNRLYSFQYINKKIRRDSKILLEEIKLLADSKETQAVAWEEVSLREVKYAKLGKTKEFKPQQSIFTFLDSVFPGNASYFVSTLQALTQNADPMFIYTMLVRHIRLLILVKEKATPKTVQSWQIFKYKKQADLWTLENLVHFYEGLIRIDIGMKTSSVSFTIRQSLDILAAHYL